MLKHVGRLKKSRRKVVVAYRTLPGDPLSCVAVTTENLEAADHDSLMKLVESNAGQSAYELAEAMARTQLSDGSNMLGTFHKTGKMVKFSTNEIEMTPDTNSTVSLDDLNKIIANQKGISIEDLALQDPTAKNKPKTTVSDQQSLESNVTQVNEALAAGPNDVLTDEQLASSYRSQADKLFKEAKRLREEAEELSPTKKKTKTSVEKK